MTKRYQYLTSKKVGVNLVEDKQLKKKVVLLFYKNLSNNKRNKMTKINQIKVELSKLIVIRMKIMPLNKTQLVLKQDSF